MASCPSDETLGALVNRALDDGEAAHVKSHLDDCHACRQVMIAVVRGGRTIPNDMEALAESWGDAPREPSYPFRRFGSGVGSAPAVLALLVFAIAGSLLVWAGVQQHKVILDVAGAALVLIGVIAAGVLIT